MFKSSHLIFAVVIVVALLVFKVSQKKYALIFFNGDTYSHVELSEHNNVANHFFTPNGKGIRKTDRYLQITKYDHPDLTDHQIKILRKQIYSSMRLKPLKKSSKYSFGLFNGNQRIYGLEKDNAFLMYTITGFEEDEKALRAGAKEIIANMERINTVL